MCQWVVIIYVLRVHSLRSLSTKTELSQSALGPSYRSVSARPDFQSYDHMTANPSLPLGVLNYVKGCQGGREGVKAYLTSKTKVESIAYCQPLDEVPEVVIFSVLYPFFHQVILGMSPFLSLGGFAYTKSVSMEGAMAATQGGLQINVFLCSYLLLGVIG